VNGTVKVCTRCGRLILRSEPYRETSHERMSGPPLVTYAHRDGCKRSR
jgi:hypothetical protein